MQNFQWSATNNFSYSLKALSIAAADAVAELVTYSPLKFPWNDHHDDEEDDSADWGKIQCKLIGVANMCRMHTSHNKKKQDMTCLCNASSPL